MNFNDDDNDYLWNGTGEADADVQHLEQVLGKLRYRHTELKLPAREASAPRRSRHAAALYRGLLAAGVAFVMLAAGTWLYFRRADVEGGARRNEIAVVNGSANAGEQGGQGTGEAGQDGGASNIAELKPVAAATTNAGRTGEASRVESPDKVAVERGRKIDEGNGDRTRRRARMAAVGVASNASASRAEGERAKRQLILALYITSDKLAYVQKKVQGDVATSPSKIEPERDLLR